MRLTKKYILFWESCFSNFYPVKIQYDDKLFLSSEHLFMYLKAQVFEDFEIAEQITKVGTPKEAKALGRKIKGFDEETWNEEREECMEIAVYEKFKQNESICNELLKEEYRGLSFVEASPLDKIWGIGLHYDDAQCDNSDNWQGLNLLGKTLDKVRVSILNEKKAYVVDRKPRKCPHCGSNTVVSIVYGEPSCDLWQDAEEGKIILGGCCITENDPTWGCTTCEIEIYKIN